MKIVIRTDSSLSIGTGHVTRCLTLAETLCDKGASVTFVCRLHQGYLCDVIENRGFEVINLPAPAETTHPNTEPKHAGWLGTSWREDAKQTRCAIESLNYKPEWLIVDHYALDYRWEQLLRPSVVSIFIIDDIADRRHDCDVLLDQNLVENMQERYHDKVPDACKVLLGPQYALLQPAYSDLHEHISPREGPIERVLIFFGGTDEHNLTGLALRAFLSLQREDIQADVVIGCSNRHAEAIQRLSEGHPNVRLHDRLPSLAPLMAQANLAIGASGATSWERLCLGLPSLVITVAKNQIPIAEALHRRELIRWLGHKDTVRQTDLEKSLAEAMEGGVDKVWSQRCHTVVDGYGAKRVQTVMLINSNSPLTVRHARRRS